MPADRRFNVKGKKIVRAVIVVLIVLMSAVACDNPVFGGACAAFLMYVCVQEIESRGKTRKMLRFLSEMDVFLGNLRHQYFRTGLVRDAFYFANDGIGEELSPKIKEMLEILESEDIRTRGTAYLNSDNNKFLRLLMSIAMLVEENGDRRDRESESVFINAIMQMRLEVRDERRYISSRMHKFTGLTLTSSIPLAAVPFIASWGVSTNSSLLLFYYGRTGSLLRAVLLVVCLLCYNAVRRLKDPEGNTVSAATGIPPETLRLILFSGAGLLMFVSLIIAHSQARKLIISDISNISMISEYADGKQLAAMEYLIPQYTLRLINGETVFADRDELAAVLLDEQGIRTSEVALACADEILERADSWKREHIDLPDAVAVLLAALMGFAFTSFEKLFDHALREGRIRDEIMQFQSIIAMQKDVPGITSVTIMESLESFARLFKGPIRKCLNNYGVNDILALTEMKESDRNADFRRIGDCFISADELGVKDAFDEISAEIRAFREDRNSDRNIILDNDALLASVLSIIPGGLILFGYLLVPFILSALSLFDVYQSSLKDYISIT